MHVERTVRKARVGMREVERGVLVSVLLMGLHWLGASNRKMRTRTHQTPANYLAEQPFPGVASFGERLLICPRVHEGQFGE